MISHWMQVRMIRLSCLAFGMMCLSTAWAGPAQEETTTAPANEHAAAVRYFQELAEKGDPVGHYYLGSMYAEGKGVVRYPKKAAQHYEQAASKGFAPAQFALGQAFASGLGTPKDYARAAKWWERAAKQGHSEAQYELGQLYQTGLGVKESHKQAIKWYRLSAQQGHPKAQAVIAELEANEAPMARTVGQNATPASENPATNEASPSQVQPSEQALAQEPAAEEEPQPSKIPANEEPMVGDSSDNAAESVAESIAQASIAEQQDEMPGETLALNQENWIMSQPGDNYTIQIFFERSENKVHEFLDRLGGAEKSASFVTRHKGRDYLAVIYGSYPTYSEARGVLDGFPEDIMKNLPWIREYNHIQSSLVQMPMEQATEGELAAAED